MNLKWKEVKKQNPKRAWSSCCSCSCNCRPPNPAIIKNCLIPVFRLHLQIFTLRYTTYVICSVGGQVELICAIYQIQLMGQSNTLSRGLSLKCLELQLNLPGITNTIMLYWELTGPKALRVRTLSGFCKVVFWKYFVSCMHNLCPVSCWQCVYITFTMFHLATPQVSQWVRWWNKHGGPAMPYGAQRNSPKSEHVHMNTNFPLAPTSFKLLINFIE